VVYSLFIKYRIRGLVCWFRGALASKTICACLIKLKLSHYTPRRRLEGEEVWLLLILDLGTRWWWVVSVLPLPLFTPGESTPGTHCTAGWAGHRAGLDTEARGKILSPLPVIEPRSPGRPARSLTLYWLSYLAHIYLLLKEIKSERSYKMYALPVCKYVQCRAVYWKYN
jgi:hypothetical protein